jgi:hypothetical protein
MQGITEQIISHLEAKKADDKAYQAYFAKMLKKYKVESPEDLSDEDRKKFFADVDKGWNSDHEQD